MTKSKVAPFTATKSEYSDLETIARAALRRFGDYSAGRVDGETMMVFIELANRIVEDVRMHPYWTGGAIDYYTAQSETRPIPDMILIDGLAAHIAYQQGSEKTIPFFNTYHRNLNSILYQRKYGGFDRLDIQVPDKDDKGYSSSPDRTSRQLKMRVD